MWSTTSWWPWPTPARPAPPGGVVAALKAIHDQHHRRIYKPRIAEPGDWLQYDFGTGPVIAGTTTVLFWAWLGHPARHPDTTLVSIFIASRPRSATSPAATGPPATGCSDRGSPKSR